MKNLILLGMLCLSLPNWAQNSVDFEKTPQLAWKYQTQGAIVASPIVDGNLVFVGSLDSTLYALDKNNGVIKWKFRISGVIRSTVCIEQNQLFLLGGDGILYCLDKNLGKIQWRFRTFNGYMGEREVDFADYYHSSPILHKGVLFFGSGSAIFAIKSNNGEFIWSFPTNDVVHTKPAISGEKLFIGSFDGHLYALNTTNGQLIWKFKTVGQRFFPKGEVMGNPQVVKGLVLFGARDFNFYALDVNGGYCHWLKQFPRGWALPITPNDSVIYLGTSDDRQLFAIDVQSGETRWKAEAKFNVFGGCSLSKNMAYFGNLMGKLLGIDLKTGVVKWIFETEAYQSNHLKYLNANDDYRPDIGQIIRKSDDVVQMYADLGAIFSTPAISDNLLIISTLDGKIYALKK